MKKIRLLFGFSLFIFHFSVSYEQSWEWGAAGYGSIKTNDYGSPVATDKNGNAYITGQFENSITFGSVTLTSPYVDAFLAKYDPAGNIMWAEQATDGINDQSFGTSVTTDKLGNIYICGTFNGAVSFGTFALSTSSMNGASFLVKYSSSGNVIWALQSTGPAVSISFPQSVYVNDSNNLFLTGYFDDTVSFGSVSVVSLNSFYNVYIVKFDSLGNAIWGEHSTSPSDYGEGFGTSVYSDNLGNVYIGGYFEDTIVFGTTSLISQENSNSAFIVKYSSSGNPLWAIQSMNESYSSSASANSVIIDTRGYCYVAGYFENIVKFGSNTLYSPGTYSAFVSKYDSAGNNIWTKQTSPGWYGSSLALDFHNHIYFGGASYYENPDSLKFNKFSLGTNPWDVNVSFLLKLDTAGNPLCGSVINNIYSYQSNMEIASDSSGSFVYMAGIFNDSVICGPDTIIPTGGDIDVILARWNNCNVSDGIPQISSNNQGVLLFPNPNSGKFAVQLSDVSCQSSVEIYNMLGEEVFAATLSPQTPKGAFSEIDLDSHPNGVYLYRIISETGRLIGDGKFVIEK